jgi:hypothetical protein
MMHINKFGISEQSRDATNAISYHQWRGLVRNFVRDNALCRTVTDFDARSRKIRRVAQPETDDNAVNKLYVDQCVKSLRNQLKESDEKLTALEKDVRALQTVVNELRPTNITRLERGK